MKKLTTTLGALAIVFIITATSCTKERMVFDKPNTIANENILKADTPYLPSRNIKLDTPYVNTDNFTKADTPYVKH